MPDYAISQLANKITICTGILHHNSLFFFNSNENYPGYSRLPIIHLIAQCTKSLINVKSLTVLFRQLPIGTTFAFPNMSALNTIETIRMAKTAFPPIGAICIGSPLLRYRYAIFSKNTTFLDNFAFFSNKFQ